MAIPRNCHFKPFFSFFPLLLSNFYFLVQYSGRRETLGQKLGKLFGPLSLSLPPYLLCRRMQSNSALCSIVLLYLPLYFSPSYFSIPLDPNKSKSRVFFNFPGRESRENGWGGGTEQNEKKDIRRREKKSCDYLLIGILPGERKKKKGRVVCDWQRQRQENWRDLYSPRYHGVALQYSAVQYSTI